MMARSEMAEMARTGLPLAALFLATNASLALAAAYMFTAREERSFERAPAWSESFAAARPPSSEEARPTLRSLIVPERPAAPPVRPDAPLSPARRPAPAAKDAGARGGLLARADSAYSALLFSPRYRRSPVILAWTREFLSHPDLKAIDDRYDRDGDALRFVADMVRSPNFQAMAVRYLAQGEARRFLSDLARDPGVLSDSPTLLRDPILAEASKTLERAGILAERAQKKG